MKLTASWPNQHSTLIAMKTKIEPDIAELNEQNDPIVKNAIQCGICLAPADRYCNRFQCQNNPNHIGDLNVGIFSDLTYPEKKVVPHESSTHSTTH